MTGVLAKRHSPVIAFFAMLFVIEWYLYFRNPGHFFQADTLFLLYHRATSISDLLREFIKLHPSGWYRPLSNEPVASVLFPFLGLSPAGYRIPVYALFIGNTIAVYALILTVSNRRLVAAFATLFFATHTVNAIVTYDLGFLPELLYTLFYLISSLLFVRYIRSGDKWAYGWSLVCFVVSLLSKEGAVTLPGILFVLQFLMASPTGSLGSRVLRALRSTAGHCVILAVYLAFVVGILHVQEIDVTKLLSRPASAGPSSYDVAIDSAIFKNADIALTWAFNLPRGWATSFRQMAPATISFLKIFRMIVLALGVCLMFTPHRKLLVLGGAWFFLALVPVLPLAHHFVPYYLFLPVVGLSLFIGVVFAWTWDRLYRVQRFAPSILILVFAGVLFVCAASIRADARDHPWLGGSAHIAERSLADLKRMYPAPPSGAVIYIDDNEAPIAWEQSFGGLFRMGYGRDDLKTLYASSNDAAPANAIVLRYHEGRLTDDTEAFRKDPSPYRPYQDSGRHALSLSQGEAVRGRDSYIVQITGTQDAVAKIAYTLDDGPIETFLTQLDGEGRANFDVGASTRTGRYRFIGFNIQPAQEWIRCSAAIVVK